ncbi:hypothetical protein MGG_15957 [Pyricularia oryzae 70-15]|uniref:Uncharacterized protein n=1 Tax=Pyricularia oryzae (strain 70-15 / ATCC MYA-4617 / FGSC 8958) TaxID=242507 RepID=G4MX83_PYRO7|nr:uncharacterized protein MGG_15957 [Pyricularia oryzae 70-15]EHA55981.1 hypothetical protein MGG_15957 [Pyricularia oryzae 70-15]
MHGCYCRDEAKPGSHERTRTTTVSGGKKEPMSPYVYAWAFINLTVRGNHQIPKLLLLLSFCLKTTTKVGKAHKAHTSRYCTWGWVFTHTIIVPHTTCPSGRAGGIGMIAKAISSIEKLDTTDHKACNQERLVLG